MVFTNLPLQTNFFVLFSDNEKNNNKSLLLQNNGKSHQYVIKQNDSTTNCVPKNSYIVIKKILTQFISNFLVNFKKV